MFDLVEEDLSKQETKEEKTPTIPSIDAVVYTMPEKFRRASKPSNSKFVLISIVLFVFLGITATIVFLIFAQAKQPLPPQETHAPSPEEQAAISAPVTATSTETIQEAIELPSSETTTPLIEEPMTEEGETLLPLQEGAALQDQKVPEPPAADVNGVSIALGLDTDGDGLTDVEERLYNTNSQVLDTDSDQFTDGEELVNMFDPIRADGGRLEISGLISPFTNRTFSYSFFYPASWSARAVNQSDKEVIISSSTGEFVSIAVQENPSQLSAIDWYISFVDPAADTSEVKTLSLNNWSAVLDPAGRSTYLIKIDASGAILAPYVYILKYNPNTSTEAQFQSTFMMMIKSFVFTDLSFVR